MPRSIDKDPIYQGLLLSLPMREGTGTVLTQDVAKPHHPVTLVSAPVWTQLPSGLWVLDFNRADPDYISCPAAASVDLDFTAGDHSIAVWLNLDMTDDYSRIFNRGSPNVDGWYVYMMGNGSGGYKCNWAAGGGAIYWSAGVLEVGKWLLLGFSRIGSRGRIFKNGVDVSVNTTWPGNSLTANRNFLIGSNGFSGTGSMDGKMWNPRIWGRALAPSEHMSIFHREREWFNV